MPALRHTQTLPDMDKIDANIVAERLALKKASDQIRFFESSALDALRSGAETGLQSAVANLKLEVMGEAKSIVKNAAMGLVTACKTASGDVSKMENEFPIDAFEFLTCTLLENSLSVSPQKPS